MTIDFDDIPRSLGELDAWVRAPGHLARYSFLGRILLVQVLKLTLNPDGFNAALFDTVSKAMLAVAPVYALGLMCLYLRARRTYAEHLVFALHAQTFAFVLLAAVPICGAFSPMLAGYVGGLVALVSYAYTAIAMRAVYGEGLLISLFKAALTGVWYAVSLLLVVVAAAVVAFLRT
jgi:hypothetical protein